MNGYRFKCCDLNDLTSTNWKKLLFLIIQVVIRFLRLSVIGLILRRVSKLIIIGLSRTVDVKSKLRSNKHFVLASQATQLYYTANVVNPKSPWYTVVTIKTRAFTDTTPFNNDEALQEEISSPRHIKADEEVGILIDLDDYEVEVHDEDLNNNLTEDGF